MNLRFENNTMKRDKRFATDTSGSDTALMTSCNIGNSGKSCSSKKFTGKCFHCGEVGHKKSECSDRHKSKVKTIIMIIIDVSVRNGAMKKKIASKGRRRMKKKL